MSPASPRRRLPLPSWLPASRWLADYQRRDLSADGLAAVIVTLMLIPQSLAYALLAGVPAQMGLYASILPLVAYALFGSSRTLAVGPVAVISLMTAAAAGQVAGGDSATFLLATTVLALLSGLMLVGMGLLRLGWVANLLSHSVIGGFISASGLLIAASQLKHLLGIPLHGDTLWALGASLLAQTGRIQWTTVILGLLTLAFLFWARSGLKSLLARTRLSASAADLVSKAAPVLAVILTTLAVEGLDLRRAGVATVGAIPGGLPALSLPAFDAELWRALLLPALLISLIGFVESVSVAQTLAAKRRQRIDSNAELTGLGMANLASAVSGGFPVTGGFSRSVVNFDAGARSPLAGILTAVGIALTALFFTPWFQALPKATLAATIIVAVLSLVDLGALARTWRYSRADGLAMAVTMAGVLLMGVEVGVIAGVLSSLLLFLWRTGQPHVAELGQVPGTEHFRNVQRHQVQVSPSVLSLRVDESLYFANARHLEDQIYDCVMQRPQIRHVVLLCSAVNQIDASALDSLESLNQRLGDAGVTLHLSEVKGPVMDRLRRSPFPKHLHGRIFLTHFDALRALDPASLAPPP
ncbi:SulP family inorganic anion transporter [Alloalcanivorax xenomutans]|uniref:Sulfate permease n=1 Tax=Alloalcanivorax xenomutans TaxID=1094342 RepID=A0A9Q3ZEZ7_9GAMM|nr:sulfate permease [Alloalcanivorax xenomutans]KYZ84971.1 sodium-independent anion transporter [Alcanivorax sp. KX64203]MCE7509011.1 sulfate permease [Alloalcanivorax xenomutans]WOD29475.1 sulfate permease [Alloalcanivorax xenomutans]